MQRASVESVVLALDEARARYLIVGGLAVVAHGYVRLTADLDLVLDFEDTSVRAALKALSGLGYRPRPPVPLEQFAEAERRAAWIADKNLKVFSLYSPEHPMTEIDLFVESPFDFGAAYARAARLELSPGIAATFVSLDDLLELKRRAGRPQDLADIARLEQVRRERQDG